MRIGHVEASLHDTTVRLLLLDEPPVNPHNLTPTRGYPRRHSEPAGHAVGIVYVEYPSDEDDSTPTKLSIELMGEPITPTALQRFPWTRALAAADAARRARQINTIDAWRESAARSAEVTGQRVAKRRGRPDLGQAFYDTIAQRYLALRAEGCTNPNVVLAEKYFVNRNTAAGWVRKARERGLLPPGRPGRAG
jgi:hypothetical protein